MRTPRTLPLVLSGAALLAVVGGGIAVASDSDSPIAAPTLVQTPAATTTPDQPVPASAAPVDAGPAPEEAEPVVETTTAPQEDTSTTTEPTAKGYTLPAGKDSGYLTGFGGDSGGTLAWFDRAYALSSEEAVAHGYPEPAGDVHVQNDNPEERSRVLAPGALVTVFDENPEATRVISAAEFLDGYDSHTGGFYDFTLDADGAITAATEIWLP